MTIFVAQYGRCECLCCDGFQVTDAESTTDCNKFVKNYTIIN